MTTYLSDSSLTGKTSGQITSSGKVTCLGKKGTVWYEIAQTPDGWLYSTDRNYQLSVVDEPPVAAVSPPPPVIKAALSRGEAFIQSDTMTVGFNAFGGIGSLSEAPEDFRWDKATIGETRRVGLYAPPLNDAILQGCAIEGFILEFAGASHANMQLTGGTGIKGEFATPLHWRGRIEGLEIDQRVTLDGNRLLFAVTLTNRIGGKITGLRYARAVDPDQSDKYETVNKVVGSGALKSKLRGGGTLNVRSDDVRAFIATTTFNKAAHIGTARKVGQLKGVDEVMQLVFGLGELDAGASITLHFAMGIEG